ncbi:MULTISPECIES: hypothetical protein [Rhizobium/Agrobacterium group]|uniref:HTH luxR-type domain-containing protein n=1 Tax=Rhizobium rhizogenes TaxID=359 RepID=A0A546XCJ9_RHIRH|nr:MULTISPECIES: hypothetical protein [Rhizobium/Agrobacterium group]TRA98482.1 hypothetical protein EXN68_20465 [Rhizobium rhizogenes]
MSLLDPALRTQLYEAAFIPERWVEVLNELRVAINADAGYLYSVGQKCGVHTEQRLLPVNQDRIHWGNDFHSWVRKSAPEAVFGRFASGANYEDAIPPYLKGYVDLCRGHSIGDDIATIVAPPTGNMIVCGFDRHVRNGAFAQQQAELLNTIYPDLVQSAFIAARSHLQQQNSVVQVMEGLGTPCISISAGRHIHAMNKQFETRFAKMCGAWNRLDLSAYNEHLDALLRNVETDQDYAPRSMGIRNQAGDLMVLHLVPIRRAAHDIFATASCFVFVTSVNGNGIGPDPELLKSLFGLTNKEAQLSSELTAGYPLRQTAEKLDISFGTARSYLLRVFQKTGTTQQSQLVGLLSKVSPIFITSVEPDASKPPPGLTI